MKFHPHRLKTDPQYFLFLIPFFFAVLVGFLFTHHKSPKPNPTRDFMPSE